MGDARHARRLNAPWPRTPRDAVNLPRHVPVLAEGRPVRVAFGVGSVHQLGREAAALDGHFRLDGDVQPVQHLASSRSGRGRADQDAPISVLDQLDETVVARSVDPATGRGGDRHHAGAHAQAPVAGLLPKVGRIAARRLVWYRWMVCGDIRSSVVISSTHSSASMLMRVSRVISSSLATSSQASRRASRMPASPEMTSVLRDGRLPQRLYPGYWDNLARCCGTAGIGKLLPECGPVLRPSGRG